MAAYITALIFLSAVNLVISKFNGDPNITEVNGKKEVNKDDINEIIYNYEENFAKIQSDLLKIINNIETNRLFLKSDLIKFKNLLKEDVFRHSDEQGIYLEKPHIVGVPNLTKVNDKREVNNDYFNEMITDYAENFANMQLDLLTVKGNLQKSRFDLEFDLTKFKNNLLNEDVFKIYDDQVSDDYQCRTYGKHCKNSKCPDYSLDKENYNKSIEVFSNLLFADFDDKFIKFEHGINNLLTDVLTSEMLIYIQTKLNNQNEDERLKEEIMNSLDETKNKALQTAKDAVIAFKILNKNGEEFKRYIEKNISEKKLKYACCMKSFDFDIDIEGFRCDPSSTDHENNTISLSHDDLGKFALFKRNY